MFGIQNLAMAVWKFGIWFRLFGGFAELGMRARTQLAFVELNSLKVVSSHLM